MMKSAQMARVPVIVLLIMASARVLEAQDVVATSCDQLRMLAKPGDTITVTDTSGHEVAGKLADLSPASFTLVGNNRSFVESEVRAISRRDHASLGTGAMWGLGVGAGAGSVLAYRICRGDNNSCGGASLRGALALGGIGAGVGVLIRGLMHTRRLIYARPDGATTGLTVSPVFTRERRGISVSFGF